MPPSLFVGVDLAWQSDRNPSGVALMLGDQSGAELVEVAEPLRSLADVLAYIRRNATSSTVIAIDAPLIIANDEGQRLCETLVGRRYGARHASCHTSNRRRYPNAASTRLAAALEADGFVHAPGALHAPEQRIMLEVYPHAAMVALFDLPCIIKYKKGSAAQKCSGLRELQKRIASLAEHTPPLHHNRVLERVLNQDATTLTGVRRKAYEDGLDAIVCAYLAYFYWFWRFERAEIFGDVESGYIVNPTLSPLAPGAVAV